MLNSNAFLGLERSSSSSSDDSDYGWTPLPPAEDGDAAPASSSEDESQEPGLSSTHADDAGSSALVQCSSAPARPPETGPAVVPPGGAQLARTSSAELVRQRSTAAQLARTSSAEERKRRNLALAKRAADEAEERAVSAQLEAVQREVVGMHAVRISRRPNAARSKSMGSLLAPASVIRQLERSVSTATPSSRASGEIIRPMEERAVTVEWLVAFADRHNAWRMKTWEVVQNIIKPLTLRLRCRFCELQSEVPDGVLGLADSFLSHCWGNEFGDLVSAARHNARVGRRYWVDIFAVNQHMSSEADKRKVKFKLSRASGKVLANQPVAVNEQGEFVPQFEDDLRRLNHVVVSFLPP